MDNKKKKLFAELSGFCRKYRKMVQGVDDQKLYIMKILSRISADIQNDVDGDAVSFHMFSGLAADGV